MIKYYYNVFDSIRIGHTHSQRVTMYRQQLDDKYSPYHQSRPRNHNNNSLLDENNQKPIVSEWKFAVSGLILSLLVIIAKLYYANRKYYIILYNKIKRPVKVV